MPASNFDVTHGPTAQEPLVAEGAGAGAGGAKAKLIGIGVAILVVLAVVAAVVVWIVTRPSPPRPPPDPSYGGKYCMQANWDGNCEKCQIGYMLSDTEGLLNRCFYKCESNLEFPSLVNMSNKGICLDDTTHQWCSDNMPFHWPNTNEPVKSIRMFKAWQQVWTDQNPWLNKTEAWVNMGEYFRYSGAKVLVGTQVTCDPDDDDSDWADVKEMLQIFGPEAIMGVAIGNEMELLYQKDLDDWNGCMEMMWNGNNTAVPRIEPYFRRVFKNRVNDLNLMPGFENVTLTSVFGGAVFTDFPFVNRYWQPSDEPYPNKPFIASVGDFLADIVPRYSDRWVWSLNIYPYFDPGNNLDPDGIHCDATIARATCFNNGAAENCLFSGLVASMRQRMASFAYTWGAGGGFFGRLWVGETGWSAPMSETLSSEVQFCADFSSVRVFEDYYRKFLSWDLQIPHLFNGEHAEFRGPDHVFWFTIRDSSNFDKKEHFGLIGDGDPTQWCTNTTCKLDDRGYTWTTTTPYTGPPTTTKTTTVPTTSKSTTTTSSAASTNSTTTSSAASTNSTTATTTVSTTTATSNATTSAPHTTVSTTTAGTTSTTTDAVAATTTEAISILEMV